LRVQLRLQAAKLVQIDRLANQSGFSACGLAVNLLAAICRTLEDSEFFNNSVCQGGRRDCGQRI
jgi:hypothetical protein